MPDQYTRTRAQLGTPALDVLRRAAMNSEFAWDTGRMPQPWVIPLGLALCFAAHLFFRWSMRRAGGGTAPYSDVVVAVCGVLLGVLLGYYLATPPMIMGMKVGPASGQSTPWGILGWGAYYARVALPAVMLSKQALMMSPGSGVPNTSLILML